MRELVPSHVPSRSVVNTLISSDAAYSFKPAPQVLVVKDKLNTPKEKIGKTAKKSAVKASPLIKLSTSNYDIAAIPSLRYRPTPWVLASQDKPVGFEQQVEQTEE